jgi:putative transposase
MTEKFKNTYRIPSARLQKWDYGCNAAYFITICTQNRQDYFGEIHNQKMVLSEIGIIAENEWLKTFKMRPDMNLTAGEFVVMPNHFHAIIIIGKNIYNSQRDMQCDTHCSRDAMHCVSNDTDTNTSKNKFGSQSKNLASIVRGYKTGVTRNARLLNPNFAWQSRFYDHIIRNDKSHKRISEYIINNPKKWKEDKFRKNEK